jgi:hypothetical protein
MLFSKKLISCIGTKQMSRMYNLVLIEWNKTGGNEIRNIKNMPNSVMMANRKCCFDTWLWYMVIMSCLETNIYERIIMHLKEASHDEIPTYLRNTEFIVHFQIRIISFVYMSLRSCYFFEVLPDYSCLWTK